MPFLQILAETIPVFIVIGLGGLCRATSVVKEDAERSLMRLVLNLLYPCLILNNVVDSESLKQLSVVGLALACGFGLTLSGMLVAYLTGTALRIAPGKDRNTFCLATAIQNYGFIPIPLIAGLFPAAIAKETLGVLFIHNLGLELALWTVGIMVVSGTAHGAWRRLLNGPTIAILAGLTLNMTSALEWTPQPVVTAVAQLGSCAVPVSLLLVGVSLAGVLIQESWKTEWRIVVGASLVRFAIMPLLFLMLARLVALSEPLQLVLIVEAAMPAAVFPIVIAKHFGGRPAVAVQVCLVTSIASLALTPVILSYGLAMFGIEVGP